MKRLVLNLMAAGALGVGGVAGEPVNLLSISGDPVPGGTVWPEGFFTNGAPASTRPWINQFPGTGFNTPTQSPIPNLKELLMRGTNLLSRSNLSREYYLKWRQGQRHVDASSGLLKPGVYETRPYTMIVKAPGGMDENMIADMGAPPRMLRTVPGLEFVPRGGSEPSTNTAQGK